MPRDSRLYMTFPIDFWTHEKVAPLSDAAFRAFVEMNGHSRMQLTDGVIAERFAEHRWGRDVLNELVESDEERPLVLHHGKSYVIRDFAEHQFTNADIEKMRADKVRAGQASATARAATRAQQALNSRSNRNQLGVGEGLGEPSSKEEGAPPSRFCSKHPTGTENACRACGDARRARDDWDKAEKNKPSPTLKQPDYCPEHPYWVLPCEKCQKIAEEGS